MTDTKPIQPLATVFLQTLLGGGPVRVSEVEARARAAGLLGSRQTISQSKIFKHVKTELGIKSVREGFGSRGVWRWVLPQPALETTRSPDEIEQSGHLVVKPGSVLLRATADNTMTMPEEFPGLDAVPLEWRRGVAHLGRRAAPRDVRLNRWHQFTLDCHRFIVDGWAERAAKTGWSAVQLFGCHPVNPLGYRRLAGLLWDVEGGHIVRLRADGADIETATGAQRAHHRRRHELTRMSLPWSMP